MLFPYLLWLICYQAVFQRYLRPEKDYLSFSLIYNNGKRSLDLVGYLFFYVILFSSFTHNRTPSPQIRPHPLFSGFIAELSFVSFPDLQG